MVRVAIVPGDESADVTCDAFMARTGSARRTPAPSRTAIERRPAEQRRDALR